nr:MAG TPA: hypothetical protein [Caudoviricetes sp.]
MAFFYAPRITSTSFVLSAHFPDCQPVPFRRIFLPPKNKISLSISTI